MASTDQSTPLGDLVATNGVTHLEIVCCGMATYKPIRELPDAARRMSIVELAPYLKCTRCDKHATPARIGLWKHGMRRLPTT